MKYFIIDVFTDTVFAGNPAGVCLLDSWPEDQVMQQIAFENNLSETAFLVKQAGYYDLRWFTPEIEIDLCGHATLASAFTLMNYIEPDMMRVEFRTQSGVLTVTKDSEVFTLDFPSRKPVHCKVPEILESALGVSVIETHASRDLLVLVGSAELVAQMQPDFQLLGKITDYMGIIVTAQGDDCDFVSRFFVPNAGINEDPVTGSSHCSLIPFWSERLNKHQMTARQLSKRGGSLLLEDCGERVRIGGRAVLYMQGEIMI